MSIRLPRLLDAQGRERTRLQPARLALELHLTPPSAAEMTLAADDADLSVRDFVELYDEQGSAGIFRVEELQQQPGLNRTACLQHGVCTLSDAMVPSMTFAGSVRDCLTRLLAHQEDVRWALGDVDVPEGLTVCFVSVCEDVLTAVLRLLSLLPAEYALGFDQRVTPWLLHLRRLPEDAACEGRLSRNLSSVAITVDASDLCTRVYPFGAGQSGERVSLRPLLGCDYLESDAAALWGVVSRSFTAPAIYDAPTLRDVAQRYLDQHAAPAVSMAVTAVDLAALTGESTDAFRLGRVCRLALPDAVYHERIVQIEKPDVYGAPGLARLTLSTRIRDTSDEIAALLSSVTADRLVGGRVEEIAEDNYAEGTATAPVVHYFTLKDWRALLDVRVSWQLGSGVTMRELRVDGVIIPEDVWRSGEFSALAHLKQNDLGQPAPGQHYVSFYPSDGIGSLSGVHSTVTMKIIRST